MRPIYTVIMQSYLRKTKYGMSIIFKNNILNNKRRNKRFINAINALESYFSSHSPKLRSYIPEILIFLPLSFPLFFFSEPFPVSSSILNQTTKKRKTKLLYFCSFYSVEKLGIQIYNTENMCYWAIVHYVLCTVVR